MYRVKSFSTYDNKVSTEERKSKTQLDTIKNR